VVETQLELGQVLGPMGLAEVHPEPSEASTSQKCPPTSNSGRFSTSNMKRLSTAKNIKKSVSTGSFFDLAQRSKQQSTRSSEVPTGRTHVASQQKRCWIIDPRTNRFIQYWDAISMVALVFTAFITPYEVGFLEPPPDRWQSTPFSLFWVNRAVDLTFLMDMGLQFCLGYSVTSGGGKYWEFDARTIALNYVTSPWFYLDAFSIGVSGFDMFGSDDISAVSALRAVRTLRLIKLVRLTRGSRVFKRWEMRVSINYTYLSLVTTCVSILLTCHWFACIWGLQASFNRLGSWLGATYYCIPLNTTSSGRGTVKGTEAFPFAGTEIPLARFDEMMATCAPGKFCYADCTGNLCRNACECEAPINIYVYALYWSVMTTTSVGYGDIAASPFNVSEQLVCTLMMLVGGMLWGHLIGTFCGIAAQLSPDLRIFRDHLSGLNAFMRNHSLPHAMRFKLREYMHQSVHLMHAKRDNDVLRYLSRQMQLEVAWFVHRVWLERVWYLDSEKPTSRVVLLDLAARLRAGVFPPGELCPPGQMYVVSRGIALRGARVFRAGGVWGEDILLAHAHLQKNWPAMAMSYLWVYTLDGQTMLTVIANHPEASFDILKLRQRWLVCRGIVRLAELQKKQELEGTSTHRGFMGALEMMDAERIAIKCKANRQTPRIGAPALPGGAPGMAPPKKREGGSGLDTFSAGTDHTDPVVPYGPSSSNDDGNETSTRAEEQATELAQSMSELRAEVLEMRQEMLSRDAKLNEQMRRITAAVEALAAGHGAPSHARFALNGDAHGGANGDVEVSTPRLTELPDS